MNTRSTSLRRTAAVVFAGLAVCICLSQIGRADIVGSSVIQDCLKTDEGITCDQKLIFTNTVSYGLQNDMEIYTMGTTGDLEEAVTLEMSKSRPSYYYPLTYFHTVAYYPHEETISSFDPDAPCNRGCEDSPESDCPTCGWVTKNQVRVEDSQGFCGNGEAHCLQVGEVLFHGYEIGTYHKNYEISIKIEMIHSSENHIFKLRPDNPFYATKHDNNYMLGDFELEAALIGDQDQYIGVPELDNFILYIPAHPAGNAMVDDYQNNMLLVPREAISKDGTELDKVGVSYHAFRMLGSVASLREPGDGLGNQLFHLRNFDVQRLAVDPTVETTYLVHGKRVFKRSMEFMANMDKVLEYRPSHIQHSLVSLKTDNVTLKQIKTESMGIIVNAQAETFSSMTSDGVLNVQIKNVGDYKADYIVTVTATDWSEAVVKGSIPPQARTLDPKEEVILSFDIFMDQNLQQSHELRVSLKGDHGKEYDWVFVVFDTVKHHEKEPWELYMENRALTETTETQLYLLGDHNCDGKVNNIDLARLAAQWSPAGDDRFDMADLLDMARCWLEECQ